MSNRVKFYARNHQQAKRLLSSADVNPALSHHEGAKARRRSRLNRKQGRKLS